MLRVATGSLCLAFRRTERDCRELSARLLDADWLLTDDTEARAVAQLVGLEVHGSLGVILWGAATGRLAEAEANDALDRLGRSSLWISTAVFEDARRALRKLLE
jgi:predicted nucleic acid-binding protein